jgi:arginase
VKVSVLMVPYDSGHCRARMARGPERIMQLGLRPWLSSLGHQLFSEEILTSDPYPAEIKTAFALCGQVAERVRSLRSQGYFPVVLSGNCNTAVGTISGCGCRNTAVVWFDAHGESTTPETTTSGFLDGMAIAILSGQCWRRLALTIPGFEAVSARRITLVGSRDIEPEESTLLDRIGVTRVTAIADLKVRLEAVARSCDGVYVHVDLDVLDREVAVANQWASGSGLSVETLIEAVKLIQGHATIKALGIASYDPEYDTDDRALSASTSIMRSVLMAI